MIGRVVAALAIAGIAMSGAIAADTPEAIYKAAGKTASAPGATISYGALPLQAGDLRLPAGKGPFPVAVVVHGGCWQASYDTRAGIAGFADALTRRGIATWNIEYRRVGDAGGGWPGTFQDVAAAVDKLPDIARRYPIDLGRVILVGHSAGAHLALWAASRSKLDAPWRGTAVRPVGVVAIDGPGTLAPMIGLDVQACGKPAIVPLMGGTPAEKPAEYKLASPAEHLPLGLRQLVVAADFTPFVLPYATAARQAGDTVEVLQPANANHFDIVTPGLPNGAAVLDFIAAKAFAEPIVPKP